MFDKIKEIIKRIVELAKKCEAKQPINPVVFEKEKKDSTVKKTKKAKKKSNKKKKKKG